MGTPRDYYADLELPPTADAADIRKQYRKLGTAPTGIRIVCFN